MKTEVDFLIQQGIDKIVNEKIDKYLSNININIALQELIKEQYYDKINQSIESNIDRVINSGKLFRELYNAEGYYISGQKKSILQYNIELGIRYGVAKYISKHMSINEYNSDEMGEIVYDNLSNKEKKNIINSAKNILLKIFK